MCLEYLGVGEVESAIECDSEELHILCLNKRYIEVHEAFYGRREEGLCSIGNNYSYPLDCSWDGADVLDLVKRNCDNKEECRLNIQLATVLGDPCNDVPKYLDIKYTCEGMRKNIGLLHPTNRSSAPSYPSTFANDGSAKSSCSGGYCFESEEETAPWWLVDLGIKRDINYVKIISCGNYVDDFVGAQIRIGDSPNFVENPTCGRNFTADDGHYANMYCNQIMSGQYVSVQVPDRTSTLRLCDVQLLYFDKREQTAVACDGQKLQLACAASASFFINILDVFYGRAENGKVCPHMFANHTYSGGCVASRTTIMGIVRGRCHLQKSCELDVQGDVLDALVAGAGDPCQSEFKYLEVTYQCSRYIQGELDTDTIGLASMDELLQFGCLGFKGVIDITSAYVKPSTTSIPPWAPQDSGIDVSSCSAQDVSSPIHTQCNNKKSCTVKNKEYYLGYSFCATMHQYLEVTFSCKADVSSGDITLIGCTGTDYELSLTCPDGKYIKIQDAFYGRTQVGSSSLVCPHSAGKDDSTTCRSTDTLDIVKTYCEDQRSCGLPTEESLLTASDPCNDVNTKYLEVTYNCQEGRPLNDITLYSCEDHADLFLECPVEASHIRIISAELGRSEDGMRCHFRDNYPGAVMYTECQTPDVLIPVRDTCTNERNCTVPNYWANYTNEEPCFGIYKYLQVTYRCLLDVADYNPKEASMFFINPRPTLKNFRLNNHVISTSQERNILSCMNACLALHDCVSFNFRTKRGNAGHVCQLNDAIVEEAESDFTYVNYFIYFQRDSYRQH
ncbi:uncharacterized protein LOC117304725 [Asterias rubens]|uniref:uncharacterized protein LOC117304725 n=1 Tax=Asterias rubens TaxID=7604 RepID=UPI001455A677|nr:uncharacterized protein LOC117304725 [Asterias rubens]